MGDITYIPTDEGWLYLSAILDIGSREIIGWNMSDSFETKGSLQVLRMAAKRTNLCPQIFHSEGTVASDDFKEAVKSYGLT